MRLARVVFGVAGGALVLVLVAVLWTESTGDGLGSATAPAATYDALRLRDHAQQADESRQAGNERTIPVASNTPTDLGPTAEPVESEVESSLDPAQCFASIMSNEPDLALITEWTERFAHALEVDPASVEVDPRTGRIKGRFEVLAGLGTATFAIEGSRYEVSVWPRVKGPDSALVPLRSMSWSFENDGGAPAKPGLFLQNHPDTARSVHDFVGTSAERIVGWGFTAGERGTVASPIVVRTLPEEPGAWIIGRPQSTPGSDWQGYFIDGSHSVLLGKLSPYANR